MAQPHPQRPGQIAAAFSGGVVSINRTPIYPSRGRATGCDWLTADSICTPHFVDGEPTVRLVEIDTAGRERRALLTLQHPDGISYACAGGGQWAAWTAGGVVLLNGEPVGGISPRTFGPDGTLAFVDPQTNLGLSLLHPVTREVARLSDGYCEDVTVLGWRQAFWREGATIRQVGLEAFPAAPQTVSPSFGWVGPVRIAGAWWLAYSDFTTARIVCHPAADARLGWVLGSGASFRLAAAADETTVWFAWSRVDRDLPEDLEIVPVPIATPRVPLTVAPTPAPPPHPQPEPTPEPTPMAEKLPRVVLALRDRFVERFPVPQTPGGGADHEERVRQWSTQFAQQVAFSFPGQGYGVKRASPTRPIGKDTLAQQKPDGRLFSWDLLLGAGTGLPTVNEDPTGEEINDQVFVPVEPIDHLGARVPDPDDQGPGKTPTPGSFDALLAATIAAAAAPLRAQLAALSTRLEALEQRLGGDLSPAVPRKVALKSSRGRYLRDDHETNIGVFDRDAAGAGETYELEPQA